MNRYYPEFYIGRAELRLPAEDSVRAAQQRTRILDKRAYLRYLIDEKRSLKEKDDLVKELNSLGFPSTYICPESDARRIMRLEIEQLILEDSISVDEDAKKHNAHRINDLMNQLETNT